MDLRFLLILNVNPAKSSVGRVSFRGPVAGAAICGAWAEPSCLLCMQVGPDIAHRNRNPAILFANRLVFMRTTLSAEATRKNHNLIVIVQQPPVISTGKNPQELAGRFPGTPARKSCLLFGVVNRESSCLPLGPVPFRVSTVTV